MADLSPHPLAVAQLPLPAAVLLHVEAAQRGFKNALAFRRWCRKHHVPVRRDGHRLWVKRGDVDRAIEALVVSAEAGNDDVRDAVTAITRRQH